VISLFLEAGLLSTMLLWPLITTGVLPRQFNVTPTRPFHGGGNSAPRQPLEPMHPAPKSPPQLPVCFVCAPPVIPPHLSYGSGPEPPMLTPGRTRDPEAVLILRAQGFRFPAVLRMASSRAWFVPAEQPHPSGPIHKIAEVMEAMLVHRVDPEYPPLARAAHISGTVQLRAIIARDGTVRELRVVSGNPLLVEAARAAVLQWRYRPTLLAESPSKSRRISPRILSWSKGSSS